MNDERLGARYASAMAPDGQQQPRPRTLDPPGDRGELRVGQNERHLTTATATKDWSNKWLSK